MKRPVLSLALLLLGAVFTFLIGSKLFSGVVVPLNVPLIVKHAKAAQRVVSAQNAFGLKLLSRELAHHPQNNVLLSPLSVWQCGAMAQLGAGGSTKAGLRTALFIPASTQDTQLNVANTALRDTLSAQSGVTLNVANALWVGQKFPIVPTFTHNCQTYFGAEVQNLNFSSPTAAQSINDWVSKQTSGKIGDIVQSGDLNSDTAVCLTNAVYFHGQWQTAFDASQTQDATFHCANGTLQKMPFMHLDNLQDAYFSNATFEAVSLPYRNSTCALWALLPHQGKQPKDVLPELDVAKLRKAQRNAVALQFPRFSMASGTELSDDLKTLGATQAFSDHADLSAMVAHPASIATLRHKALLEVDEEGTTAAAATDVSVKSVGIEIVPLVTFDRPFVVALVEEKSGALLMLGVVNAPEQLN